LGPWSTTHELLLLLLLRLLLLRLLLELLHLLLLHLLLRRIGVAVPRVGAQSRRGGQAAGSGLHALAPTAAVVQPP
jgi:hypothetical protein